MPFRKSGLTAATKTVLVVAMGRDFECHIYFEHRTLTAELLDHLLGRLQAVGLQLGAPGGEVFPALAGLQRTSGGALVPARDLETLLRSKEPPVGAGYGVLPFSVSREGLPAGHSAFLTFQRPDPQTGLDGASLVIDGALFHTEAEVAMDAAFAWFAQLAHGLVAVYGWADWETATFLVAAPSRRDVRAGVIARLMRFNAVGRALVGTINREWVSRSPRLWEMDSLVVFESAR